MPRHGTWEELSTSFDDNEDDIGIGVAPGRLSFSFYRLPEPLLRLSVLKLDTSSFDIQVARAANVRGLKLAVENVFRQPAKEDGIEISWSHVWSHFCLSYKDEKLIDDGVTLRSLGIKDGDQLSFVRHLSINYSPGRRQSRSREIILEKKHRRATLPAPEVLRETEENGINTNDSKVGPRRHADEKSRNHKESEALVVRKEPKLSHFLLRWFSCKKSEVRNPSSRASCKF